MLCRRTASIELYQMMGFIQATVILLVVIAAAGEARPSQNGHCLRKCGDKDIPYPFGVGDGCFLNQYFSLTCYNSKLYFDSSNIEVLNISLDGHMDISMYVFQICYNESGHVFPGRTQLFHRLLVAMQPAPHTRTERRRNLLRNWVLPNRYSSSNAKHHFSII
ncbi:wall-associated receptor kinase 2-like [Prosopis cineraria]|uniref:wall-associated receptor kinase 2-like n=1 Tax=Prosopis cineraria TaxID=364024 RepID=UPI0024104219|nr:wall-associated receptor kinase 2-like [Prosopis cineraria]